MSTGQWESGPGMGATHYPQYYGQSVPTPQPPKKTEWGSYVFGGVFMIVLGIIMLVLFSMAPGATGSGGASMAGYALVFFIIGSVLIAIGMILRNKEILETNAFREYQAAQTRPQAPVQTGPTQEQVYESLYGPKPVQSPQYQQPGINPPSQPPHH